MTNKANNYHKLNYFLLTLFIAGFFIICETGRAESFPFRTLEIGTSVPDVSLAGYKGGSGTSIKSHKGKPILLVFWGGDMAAKKKRTVKMLSVVNELTAKLKKKGVTLLVVNVQNDSDAVVKEVMDKSGLKASLYVDSSRKAYGKFGIYVLPATLLVDSKGKISGGVGYSKDIKERLAGELDVMLGSKSRKQLEAELNPTVKEMPKEEKLARRHMNMGITMVHKGQTDAAIRELKQALEYNPKLSEARVELGCIYVEQDKLDEAIKDLEKGLEQQPDLIKAEICLARVSAKMGEVQEALDDAKALLFRNGRNSELHFLTGDLQAQLGKMDAAAKSYKKAYELLLKKTMLHE